MKKIIAQIFFVLLLCSVTAFAQKSAAEYWGIKSNTVGVYPKLE